MVARKFVTFGLALLILWTAVWTPRPLEAAAPPAGAPASAGLDVDRYTLPIQDYRLANGLRVLLVKDSSAPVVAVNVTYRVGGANDPEGRSGFAHLFEHMMFHGSDNVKRGEFDVYMTGIGADYNAYTSDDETVYHAVVPSNQLPLLLWLESDRMGSLVVDAEGFETERNVVIEEYNQRVINAPYGAADRRSWVLPFQGYAPYERLVIGNPDELRAATLADVRAFHAKYYVPNNAVLAIVGDIDIAQAKWLVEAYFGDIPAGEPVMPILAEYPAPSAYPVLRTDEASGCSIGYEETFVDPLVELPRVSIMVPGPSRQHDDYYALRLLGAIIGSGNSSRLMQNIVQKGLAVSIWADTDASRQGVTALMADLTPNPEDDAATGMALLRAEFDKLVAEGVTAEELARVQNRMELDLIEQYRSTVYGTSEAIQKYVMAFDDPNYLKQEIARYRAVTVEDIQAAAQTYLCGQPMSIITVLPEGEPVVSEYPGRLVEPVAVAGPLVGLPEGVVSRTSAPEALPAGESSLPPFKTLALENGLTVYLVEQHKTPHVQAALYVGGSNTSLPEEKQGAATLLADVIVQGTTTRTVDEINTAIESIGGWLDAAADLEYVNVTASGPSAQYPVIFDILADVALNPTFPAEQFTVAQDQALAQLTADEGNAAQIARRTWRRLVFPGHPYGYFSTPESVAALTNADLADFHSTYFRPNNAILVIAGDLDADIAKQEAERVFGEWEAGDVPDYLDYPEPQATSRTAIYLIDLPGAEQATVRIGNPAMAAADPLRYAFRLANYVLGGPVLNSRLNLNLREKNGYTYGAFGTIDARRDTGYFVVGGNVGNDVLEDAVRQIRFELDRLATTPLTEEELAAAKSFLVSQFLMGASVATTYANALATTVMNGLPADAMYAAIPGYETASVQDVQDAVAKFVDAEQPIILVIGDAESAKPQLEKLGEVVMLDLYGNPVE